MFKLKKLLLINILIISNYSCNNQKIENVVFDKTMNYKYDEDLKSIKEKILLTTCYECNSNGRVFFYTKKQIKFNPSKHQFINPIYYLYFDKEYKLKEVEKNYLFDFNVTKKEISKSITTILKDEIYETNNINSEVIKNGFKYSLEIDTTKTYSILTYKITNNNLIHYNKWITSMKTRKK